MLTAGLLSGCVSDAASDSSLPTITVGSDTYPPYVYMDNNGDITGLDVDIAEEAFRRMGYRAEFTTIDWEQKTELVDNGEIDCIWDCFSMDGRENDYQWAGPYLVSRQVIAVSAQSGIEQMSDLAGKTIAVQATGKPEAIFLSGGENVPAFRNIISLADHGCVCHAGLLAIWDAGSSTRGGYPAVYEGLRRELPYSDEPLLTTGIGVAFSKNDTRGLAAQLTEVFAQMREDGSMEQLVGKYLEVPAHSLEWSSLNNSGASSPEGRLLPVPRGGAFVPRRGISAVPARGYAGLRAAHDRADRLCKGAVLLLCAV